MTRTVSSYGMGSMVNDVSAVGDVVAGEAFHRGTIDVPLRVLDAERIGPSQKVCHGDVRRSGSLTSKVIQEMGT